MRSSFVSYLAPYVTKSLRTKKRLSWNSLSNRGQDMTQMTTQVQPLNIDTRFFRLFTGKDDDSCTMSIFDSVIVTVFKFGKQSIQTAHSVFVAVHKYIKENMTAR